MINIVMPVFNRPQHTKQTIESLYQNTYLQFSLVVVDDASNEETKNVLFELCKKYEFNMAINSVNVGPGTSRNMACDRITATKNRQKYLYFSDNDVYFKPGWDKTLIECYELVKDKKFRLLGGSCHPYLQTNKKYNAIPKYDVCEKDAVSGYSHFITWETWDKFGPFDTQEGLDKKTGRSDDWAFCQKIKQAGYKVGSLEPEVIIPTGLTDSYGDQAVGQETFRQYDDIFIS